MEIVCTRADPPVFEVQGFTPKDLPMLILWLHRVDLPRALTLHLNEVPTVFNSLGERMSFAAGFSLAVDAFFPEPPLGKWMDDEERAFVVLASSKNEDALRELATAFLREIYLSKWPEHAGEEIRIHVSHDTILLVRLDLWDSLSRVQKCEMVDRAAGFTSALRCLE